MLQKNPKNFHKLTRYIFFEIILNLNGKIPAMKKDQHRHLIFKMNGSNNLIISECNYVLN